MTQRLPDRGEPEAVVGTTELVAENMLVRQGQLLGPFPTEEHLWSQGRHRESERDPQCLQVREDGGDVRLGDLLRGHRIHRPRHIRVDDGAVVDVHPIIHRHPGEVLLPTPERAASDAGRGSQECQQW